MNLKRFVRIVMTALTLALAAALCVSALALYAGGMARRQETGSATEPVFTRESVVAQLRRAAPLAGLWLIGMIVAAASGSLAPSRGQPVRAAFPPRPAVPDKTERRNVNRRAALRIALYAAAVVLVVMGILNGGMNDVLVKAINICTECIGLG